METLKESGSQVIAGMDGCRLGWVCVWKDLASGRFQARVLGRVHEVLELKPKFVAIDIPIGLANTRSRGCDQEARAKLGFPRSTSVFSAPIRASVTAATYPEACATGAEVAGRKLSRQAWGIVPKIREVDQFLQADPSRAAWLVEVHPELSFWAMNDGRAMAHSKKTDAGHAQRQALVLDHFKAEYRMAQGLLSVTRYKPDDLLDAFAALWTAQRIFEGRSVTLPDQPHLDPTGLPMRIVY